MTRESGGRMSKKIICPNCESENLTYFEEKVYTKYYKLDENNIPTRKMEYRTNSEANGCYNWYCKDCGYIFGGSAFIQLD